MCITLRSNVTTSIYSIVPACLQDASLGDHHYVTTKSGHKFHYVAKGDTDKPLMLCLHGFPEVINVRF